MRLVNLGDHWINPSHVLDISKSTEKGYTTLIETHDYFYDTTMTRRATARAINAALKETPKCA